MGLLQPMKFLKQELFMKKTYITLILSLLISQTNFGQAKKKVPSKKVETQNTFTIKILNTLENAKGNLSDTNAFKLYYVRYVIPATSKSHKPDTIWAPVIAADTNEIFKWQNIYQTTDDDLWYISKEPVSIRDNQITIWIRDWRYYVKKSSKDDPKLNYKLILCAVNCRDKTYNISRKIEFDYDDKIINDIRYNDEFQYPIPKSLGENILKYVCEKWGN